MENQDNFQPTTPEIREITLSENSREYLIETSKWAKFFGILGFILTGFMVIFALFIGSIFKMINSFTQPVQYEEFGGGVNPYEMVGSFSIVFTMIYLLMALLYFFPSLYLYKFSNKMKHGIKTNENFEVEEGFKNLKSTFKFWGIMTIIILSIYLLMFVFGTLFGAMLR